MPRHCRSSIVVTMLLAAVACGDAGVAGDPRPTADLSVGTPPPEERRPSRRSLRRASRRGRTVEIEPEPDAGDSSGLRRQSEPRRQSFSPAVPPISVDTTLGSPFGPEASERPAVHRDQPYGSASDGRQRFDIHLPPGCTGGSLPLVVWIPGDEWEGGPRSDCPVTWLVDRGYVVACISYRSAGTAIFPAQLDDCRSALATLCRDAEIWGIDPARVCVMGAGGGGLLAALAGFSKGGPQATAGDDEAPRVAAVCAVAAPSHLTALGGGHDRAASATSRLIGGPLAELREVALAASPLTHVTPDDPPTLILHGTHDAVIPAEQAERLDRALTAAGVDHGLVLLDAGHAVPLGAATPAATELLAFLDRELGPGIRVEPPAGGR